MTYILRVKRLQIYIDEDVDRALAVEARRQRKSKAALIREYVAEHLRHPGPDPVDAFVGSFEGGADLSASVDDVVYGKRE
ncbi:CopG family transcriptional regulator [Mycobacterium riyadhense]|uniref:Antitoxin n=1 Tax=Mycobacterium riyadhense TaxID=486698 RepID=A0A1X2BYH8_9MYCO|nr:CopG family transcriptional regulator [Mycobacterium riyadhense]MCV7149053.1 CopG family transcriptional regulator [Mycobacterium riyadhense]ORW68775.1 antitoxin [Mycobacterium riyadhense]VTP00251.1 Antitoxin VapB20 [Mycobacterium riyadhense]